MTTDTTYNGWANRATWLVNLHLANDEHAYLATLDVATSAYVGAFADALEHGDDEHAEAAYDLLEAHDCWGGLGMDTDAIRAILARYRDWTPTQERHGIRWVATAHQHARYATAEALKGWVDDILAEALPNPHPSGQGWPGLLTWDLITTTLAAVDWAELADGWIEDLIA